MTQEPFSDRLRVAIASGSSDKVRPMIHEAEEAVAAAVKRQEAAQARALDPMLSDKEVAEARKAADDAEFELNRTLKATDTLKAKLAEFEEAEHQADRRTLHAHAIKVRNEVSARLQERYLELANELGEILAAVVAADEVVERANRNLPHDAPRVAKVEEHARPALMRSEMGRQYPYVPNDSHWPTLVRGIVLPALTCGRQAPIWGPGQTLERNLNFTPEHPNEGAEHVTRQKAEGPEAGEGGAQAFSPASSSQKEKAA